MQNEGITYGMLAFVIRFFQHIRTNAIKISCTKPQRCGKVSMRCFKLFRCFRVESIQQTLGDINVLSHIYIRLPSRRIESTTRRGTKGINRNDQHLGYECLVFLAAVIPPPHLSRIRRTHKHRSRVRSWMVRSSLDTAIRNIMGNNSIKKSEDADRRAAKHQKNKEEHQRGSRTEGQRAPEGTLKRKVGWETARWRSAIIKARDI